MNDPLRLSTHGRQDLSPLSEFPRQASPALLESLKTVGLLQPLLVSGNRIVDGCRRWQCLAELGLAEVETLGISGDPWESRWQANLHRPWNPVEMAVTCLELSPDRRAVFCRSLGVAWSPHLEQALTLLGQSRDLWLPVIEQGLPLAVFRDLASLHHGREEALTALVGLPGTVARKRLLAGLLRQAGSRGVACDLIGMADAEEAIRLLETRLSPRRTEAHARAAETAAGIGLPQGTRLEWDPSFEHPGVKLTLQLKRNQLDRLDQAKVSLARFFARVEEL